MTSVNYTEIIVNAFKSLDSSGKDYTEFEMLVKNPYNNKDMVAKFVITTKMYKECMERLCELKREFEEVYWNGIDIDSLEEYISRTRFMPMYCTCDTSKRIMHLSMKFTLIDYDRYILLSHTLLDNTTDIDDILKVALQSFVGEIESYRYTVIEGAKAMQCNVNILKNLIDECSTVHSSYDLYPIDEIQTVVNQIPNIEKTLHMLQASLNDIKDKISNSKILTAIDDYLNK